MALVKWRAPFPSMWSSFLDDPDFFNSNWPSMASSSDMMDIYETDDDVVVKASVPGVPQDEVEVTIEGNVLTISADHQETEEEKKKRKVVYRNTRQTAFSFTTTLPRSVDAAKAEANVEDGVVTVTIPKMEAEKPKKISVTKK